MAKNTGIQQPKNTKIVHGKQTVGSLEWRRGMGGEWNERFVMAQKFVDSEVLRYSEPFVPKQFGVLIKSGTLGTVLGSGQVEYTVPYARYQYYHPREPGSETGALRGPQWFERMKAIYKKAIIEGAKKIIAGWFG